MGYPKMMNQDIKTAVSERYAEIAKSGRSSLDEKSRSVAKAFGYSEAELESIPAEANMGVSCGNPTAMAGLREGEIVVDLGSGGGLDVFLAAQRVGPTGKAIGIDMTEEMIQLAKRNAMGLENVAFHLAEIEDMPFAEDSVDCVISNCVLVLVPDKLDAFKEIYRILKPGGRLAISDMALKKTLPSELAESVAAYTGCVAGALQIEDYERLLGEAGFAAVQIIDTQSDLNVYNESEKAGEAAISCCGGPDTEAKGVSTTAALRLSDVDVNDYAASVKVFAHK